MDNSIGQTIEKIKLQEQDTEIKLREKRELNNAILSLNRAIRDSSTNLGKLSKEYECLIFTIDKLQHQLAVEKTRHIALVDQVKDCSKELEKLRDTSNDGVSSVWSKRSKLFETIHGITDKCDIWALLIKPTTCNEIVPCPKFVENNEQLKCNDSKVKNAVERRSKALAERNYLLSEPETGEEFIRYAEDRVVAFGRGTYAALDWDSLSQIIAELRQHYFWRLNHSLEHQKSGHSK